MITSHGATLAEKNLSARYLELERLEHSIFDPPTGLETKKKADLEDLRLSWLGRKDSNLRYMPPKGIASPDLATHHYAPPLPLLHPCWRRAIAFSRSQ